MRVLAIDTSNQTLSIAVVDEMKVLGSYTTNVNKNHSERLMPAIVQLLRDIQIEIGEIDRFVVAEGPGSYTGLRIGVTAAKTFAHTMQKELVGISSLQVLAANAQHLEDDYLLVPLFDARRENIYTAAYVMENGQVTLFLTEQHTALDLWLLKLKATGKKIFFLGDDVKNFQEKIQHVLGEQAYFGDASENIPNAIQLAYLGIKAKPVEAINDFIPIYLKQTQAEEEWAKQHPNQKVDSYVEKI